MARNPHLKLAYDTGVSLALSDAFAPGEALEKTAVPTWLTGGIAPGRMGTVASGVLGAGGGAAATPYITDDWDDDTTFGKTLSLLQNMGLGAAAGITGHDRFGALGALGGLGVGVGASAGLNALKPEDDGSDLNFAGRAVAEGAKSSLTASMLLSSLLRGGGGRAMLESILDRTGAGAYGSLRRSFGKSDDVIPNVSSDITAAGLSKSTGEAFPDEAVMKLLPEHAGEISRVAKSLDDDYSKAYQAYVNDSPSSRLRDILRETAEEFPEARQAFRALRRDQRLALKEVPYPEGPEIGEATMKVLYSLPEEVQKVVAKKLNRSADQGMGNLFRDASMAPFDQGGLAGLIAHLRNKEVGPVGKAFDYMFGSPNVAKAVAENEAIYKVPAKDYIKANLKDILGGTAVGAGFVPIALGARGIDKLRGIDPVTGERERTKMERLKQLFGIKVE